VVFVKKMAGRKLKARTVAKLYRCVDVSFQAAGKMRIL